MKRILLFTDVLGSGGAQRQLVTLAVLLKNRGYNVCLLDYWDDTFYDDFLISHNIPFEHVPSKGKWNIIKMFIKKVRQAKPDVVISYMENPSVVACLGKLLSLVNFKLIVSERNTTQVITRATKLRFSLFRFFADFVVPNSYSQMNFIKSHFKSVAHKTHVITNVVDLNTFTPPTFKARNEEGDVRFVVVARIVEQKNVLRFIEAVKLLKDKRSSFRVDWYGNPYPVEYYKNCTEKLETLGLKDCFSFHPSTKDIVAVYQMADVFVLPSIYEGFPNTLCEAMASGLPVIASEVCDNPFILSDSNCGFLVNPLDPSSIAEAMCRMIDMPNKQRQYMGEYSRRHMESKFSEEEFVNTYINLIG